MGKNRCVTESAATRIVAVVSVFHPQTEVAVNVAAIAAQATETIVVDDGSGAGYDDARSAITATGARLIVLEENVGIAAALNAGVKAVQLHDGDVVITFDQDSAPPAGFITALVETLHDATRSGLEVAIVAPATFAGVDQTGGELANGMPEALRPIQSGMLVTASSLRKVGLFDEGLFIDLVDVEFYLRIRAAGMASVAVRGLDLPHELGAFQSMTVLGRRVSTTLSTPFRYYYRSRNRVIVTRRFRAGARRLLRQEAFRDSVHFVLATVFASRRGAFLTLLRRGRRDGRRGITGRMPDDLRATASSISWRGTRVERPQPPGRS